MAVHSQGRAILVVTWVLGTIATIAFTGRVYTRFFFIRQASWDDYTMILTWVCTSSVRLVYQRILLSHGLHRQLKVSADID